MSIAQGTRRLPPQDRFGSGVSRSDRDGHAAYHCGVTDYFGVGGENVRKEYVGETKVRVDATSEDTAE